MCSYLEHRYACHIRNVTQINDVSGYYYNNYILKYKYIIFKLGANNSKKDGDGKIVQELRLLPCMCHNPGSISVPHMIP